MKEYKKPNCMNVNDSRGFIPAAVAAGVAAVSSTAAAIAPAAALVGGYAVGRAVKTAMEFREDYPVGRCLEKVEIVF